MRKLLPFIALATIIGCGKAGPVTAEVSGVTYTIPAGWRDLTTKEMKDVKKGFADSLSTPDFTGSITGGWTANNVDEVVMIVTDVILTTPIPEADFVKNLIAEAPSMGVGTSASEHKLPNGSPAVKVYVKGVPSGGKNYDAAMLFWLQDGKASYLTYMALPEAYKNYVKDFEATVSSMKFR